MRPATLALALCLGACGGGTSPSDGGPSDASARSDAAREDAGARDAGSSDAALPDAALPDAGSDASVGGDSGLDCSVIGCGPPTVCGDACDAPCGCCPCGDGEEVTIGGEPYVCAGGCYAPRGGGGEGDACDGAADCGAGLSCCYPCGIPGCENVCEPTCEPGTPGCAGGCLLRP